MYSAGATFFVFAAGSYASTYVRCYMLLIVPGLFAGRGRALLMTISVGLLLDGPVANLNANIQLVTKFVVCMYEQMKVVACQLKTSFADVSNNATSILEQVHNATEERLTNFAYEAGEIAKTATRIKAASVQMNHVIAMAKDTFWCKNTAGDIAWKIFAGIGFQLGTIAAADSMCDHLSIFKKLQPGDDADSILKWTQKLNPDMDSLSITKENYGDLLQTQSTANIMDRLVNSVQNFFDSLEFIFSLIKIGFYVLSLSYMLYAANEYLVKYLCDDAFDNMFVNGNLDKGQPEKLLPLRKWESREKYQMTSTKKCLKLSSDEYKRIGLLLIIPALFCLATIGIIMADHTFASYIDLLEQNGKFGISFNGAELGVQLNGLLKAVENGEIPEMNLQLQAFDLSTDPCLPVPVKTDWKPLVHIFVLLSLTVISCFLDAYLQRIRSQICNMFYPER